VFTVNLQKSAAKLNHTWQKLFKISSSKLENNFRFIWSKCDFKIYIFTNNLPSVVFEKRSNL